MNIGTTKEKMETAVDTLTKAYKARF